MRTHHRRSRALAGALSLVLLLVLMGTALPAAMAEATGFDAVKTLDLPNGETLSYREQGSGPKTIVMLHGNMSASIFYDVMAQRLPLEEYRVLAPDLRGFGDSTYHAPIASIKDFSEDIKAFVDVLGLKDITLVGWSLGAIIALQYTADHQADVAKLVLIAGTTRAIPIPKLNAQGTMIPGEYYTTRDELLMLNTANQHTLETKDYAMMQMGLNFVIYNANQPEPERYQRYLDEIFKQRNLIDTTLAIAGFNISHEFNGLTQGTGEVDKITCPVLVLQGDNDMMVPALFGGLVQADIGENAELVKLPSGHSPLEDCLDLMMEAFDAFMAK